MAVGLQSRIMYREVTTSTTDYWAGTYKFIPAKSIPSPFGDKNMVDTSILDDLSQTQEPGRRNAASMGVQCAFEKDFHESMVGLEDKKLDFLIAYGTDGKGGLGICAFQGTESIKPDEATAEHLTETMTISIGTVPSWIGDKYEITSIVMDETTNHPKSFTVAKKSA